MTKSSSVSTNSIGSGNGNTTLGSLTYHFIIGTVSIEQAYGNGSNGMTESRGDYILNPGSPGYAETMALLGYGMSNLDGMLGYGNMDGLVGQGYDRRQPIQQSNSAARYMKPVDLKEFLPKKREIRYDPDDIKNARKKNSYNRLNLSPERFAQAKPLSLDFQPSSGQSVWNTGLAGRMQSSTNYTPKYTANNKPNGMQDSAYGMAA